MTREQKKAEKFFRGAIVKLCKDTSIPAEKLHELLSKAIEYLLLIYKYPSQSKWYFEDLEEKFKREIK